MTLVGLGSPSRLGAAKDMEVCHIVVDVGELQAPLRCGLSLRHAFKFSLVMGNSEVKVRQMMFELSESEDFSDHSPIVSNFDVFEQHAVMGGGPCE
jgi:hypothetical protein